MRTGLPDADLPGFFRDADAASLSGQRRYVRWSRTRLVGAVAAAVGGAFSLLAGRFDLFGLLTLIGFGAALVAELTIMQTQPERDWYSGRALAESAKTLAWRYAVGADPFPPSLPRENARAELRLRLQVVAREARDRIAIAAADTTTTTAMDELRSATFDERKRAYIEGRTQDQQGWYARKALWNRKQTRLWQSVLVGGEVVALVLAAGRAFGAWQVDWSGILAAAIGSGAAWVSIKQYSTLASAYSVAATELGLQTGRLEDADETKWSDTVASAEEAISREHTLWLASRSG